MFRSWSDYVVAIVPKRGQHVELGAATGRNIRAKPLSWDRRAEIRVVLCVQADRGDSVVPTGFGKQCHYVVGIARTAWTGGQPAQPTDKIHYGSDPLGAVAVARRE